MKRTVLIRAPTLAVLYVLSIGPVYFLDKAGFGKLQLFEFYAPVRAVKNVPVLGSAYAHYMIFWMNAGYRFRERRELEAFGRLPLEEQKKIRVREQERERLRIPGDIVSKNPSRSLPCHRSSRHGCRVDPPGAAPWV